ncbi:hypothetical protein CURTO8I2_220207 [Curtobacterium sp. 8I-2]|nr:hypothetical protein CURTO8I2_220207 [Curtobacterium sp. 8I-2]
MLVPRSRRPRTSRGCRTDRWSSPTDGVRRLAQRPLRSAGVPHPRWYCHDNAVGTVAGISARVKDRDDQRRPAAVRPVHGPGPVGSHAPLLPGCLAHRGVDPLRRDAARGPARERDRPR